MSRVMPFGRSGNAIMWLFVAALFALAAAGSQSITAATPGYSDRIEAGGGAEGPATGLWVIRLSDPSLAAYRGGVANLAATSPSVTGARQLDVGTPASTAYLEYLQGKHAEFQTAMEQALGRSVEVQFRYLNVLNALAARVDAGEAAKLADLPEVEAVYRDTVRYLDTDVSNDLIRSTSIWDGDTGGGLATRGEGIIVGMLDTGVNPGHPSFAATDGDGYTHTNPFGAGNFVGVCDPAHPNHEDICNDKLIGAWNFHPSSPSAQDWDDHGSHVGSTIAGNKHDATFTVGNDEFTRTVQGVAPRANVISYLVCFPSCPSTSSVAAVNQAIADGTNVLNYSISGVDNPWADAVDLAFLDAFEAGMFVSASAGNSGPGASTVAKTGPWNASTGASTHSRVIANTVDAIAPTPVPEELENLGAVPGSGPAITADIEAEIRFSGLVQPGNELGCSPFPAGSFTGAIALIRRGECTFETKVTNANNAGAVAVIVFNHVGGPPITMGGLETTTIPAVFLDQGNGNDLRDFVVDNAPDPTEARINAETAVVLNSDWEDIMAGFSSRGPSQFEMLAPTYTAPGVNILAAGREVGGDPNQYAFLQGTSMSSPHSAGSGALLMALRPEWSPAQVRSALASTAVTEGILKEDATTPADPFDMGSGRLDLDNAGRIGLTMNETHANFVAANPATGGDPKTLNLPAMVDMNCTGICTWTRTVQLAVNESVTFNAVVDAPEGMDITVVPSTFTLVPGGQNGATSRRQVTITADVTGLAADAWAFADVRFETTQNHPVYGDFVELAQVPGGNTAYVQRTVDLSAYAGQEICLGFVYQGHDGHTWDVDDVVVTSDAGSHVDESFTDETFPPAGWARFNLDGAGSEWVRTTVTPNTAPAAARHAFSTAGGVASMENGWLVTPSFTPGESASLTFFDRITFSSWFTYSGVWVSTGSCDPTPSAGPPIAATHYPVAVIPRAVTPSITVDPSEVTSTQSPDQVVEKTLTIGNEGGSDLLWNVVEDEPARQPARGSTRVTTVGDPGPTRVGGNTLAGSGLEKGKEVVPDAPATPANTVTLTHSNSQAITAGNTVACSPDGGLSTTANQFLRTFTLTDFGLTGDFDVTQVSFGIENLSSAQNITVNLYTLDGTFTYANMTLIGTATAALSGQSLTIVTVPVTGTAPAGSTLVVEIAAPNLSGVAAFFPGSNTAGQTAPSYIASSACGIANPTSFAAIGFPNVHLVMNVTGTTEAPSCEAPGGTPWVDVEPTLGTVQPGNDQEVTVTFDSTGLSSGSHQANLCIESNDPNRPLVVVPLTLEVVEIPSIVVDPTSLASTQPPGTTREKTLGITNAGLGQLEWDIHEAEAPAAAAPSGLTLTSPAGVDRATGSRSTAKAMPARVMPTSNPVITGDLSEGFDDITTLPGGGWAMINNSSPLGVTGWFQGNPVVFPAHSGATNSYIGANFNNGAGVATLSNWLLTPVLTLKDGDELSFYTRTGAGSMWPDRLEVRMSTNGSSTDVGTTATSVGDFTALLHSVNPDLTVGGYPETWTQVTVTLSGVGEPTEGRLALRYFVTNGGPSGSNSNYIGIDTLQYASAAEPEACDAPANVPWLSASPTSGTTSAGATSNVAVTFDSTGLAPGSYEALLCVASNDPENAIVEVPVSLNVGVELPTFLDFNGDGSSNIAVYRPSTRQWLVLGMDPITWGLTGDVPVPADYTGDGTTDIAVFRPSNGTWWVRGSAAQAWGREGDVPVPGHYSGNAAADLAVFRPSTGTWWIKGMSPIAWGREGDVAVPGDYTGDGTTDIAVFRPSTNTWWIRGVGAVGWGAAGDIPITADFTGDGVTDIAVYRPSTRTWWIRGVGPVAWGAPNDVPAAADYSGDGMFKKAVFRPSTAAWWIEGESPVAFGATGDLALALPHSVRSVYFP
jgi:hypothetical protein